MYPQLNRLAFIIVSFSLAGLGLGDFGLGGDFAFLLVLPALGVGLVAGGFGGQRFVGRVAALKQPLSLLHCFTKSP